MEEKEGNKKYQFDIPPPPKPLSFEMPKPPILQPNVAAMLQKTTSENLAKSEISHTLNAPAPSAFKVVENPFAPRPKSVLANTNQPSNKGESKAAKTKEFSQIEESNDHQTAISEDVIKKPADEPSSVSKPEKPTSLRTSPATTEIPITPMTEDGEQITSPAVLEVSSAIASDPRLSNVFTDKIDMSGGLMSWLTKTVIESKLLNDVAEKARSSVETVITTLDPGMKPFLAEHGVIEFALFNCDSNLLTVASDAFTRAGSMAICRSLTFDETAFIANFRPLVLGEQKAYKLCEEKIEAARKTKKAKDDAAIVVVQPFLLELSKRYYSTCKIVLHHGSDYFDAISQPLEVPTTIVDAIQRAAKSEGLPDEEYSISVTQAIRSVYKTSAVSWEAGCFAPYDSNELLSFAFSSVAQQLLRNLAPVN